MIQSVPDRSASRRARFAAWWRERGGWALWALFFLVISVLAVAKPLRPITRIYHASAIEWWASQPVYTGGIHGFLYLPSSAVLFGPFTWLSVPVADHMWRLLGIGLTTWAVLRAVELVRPGEGRRVAQWVLALAIPTLSVNLLRSQWELMMFAVLLHAAVDIGRERWARGGLLLAFAVALKPLALVPALLFAAVRPRLRVWLGIGVAVALIVPFAHPDPAYVAAQYVAMVSKLTTAAQPDSGRWFELTMMLKAFGFSPAYETMTFVRIGAAIATLAAAWIMVRRMAEPRAALMVLWLAALYLVLFNPRTEEGSYANVALLAGVFLFDERGRAARALPWLLGAVALGLGAHFYGDWVYRPTETWLKQLLALGLYLYIGGRAVFAVRENEAAETARACPSPPGIG